MKRLHSVLLAGIACIAFASCDGGIWDEGFDYKGEADGLVDGEASYDREGGAGGEVNGNGNGNTAAGVLTAGEWNDLRNWSFWGGLVTDTLKFASAPSVWGFYTDNRIAVKVICSDGQPSVGSRVNLKYLGMDVWDAVTDNKGEASLWLGLYNPPETIDTSSLSLSVAGVSLDKVGITGLKDSVVFVNEINLPVTGTLSKKADIAFIVDATGSMSDEISFLKQDLLDILGKVKSSVPDVAIRSGAVFYRDEDGDEYVTRVSGFADNPKVTSEFISKQKAAGGGDFPEAVHRALDAAIQKLAWSETADNRVAFLILDAPAHLKQNVITSLHSSIQSMAKTGIRIIPVVASGADKITEFMCRFFAVTTGGTYVFLTDDSGVGGSHIEASVGEYQVEQLNDLVVRLIKENIE